MKNRSIEKNLSIIKENLSFEDAIALEEERLMNNETLTPMVMYKDMGLYYNMVKAYLDNFEDVHIIMYEDFKSDTKKVVKKTLEFLGVDPKVSLDTGSKHNVGGKSWKTPFFKHFFMKGNLVKKLFRKVFSFSVRKKLRIFLESILKQKSKPINKETRENLVMFFKEDVGKLEQLLQINLKHWKE